MKQFNHCISIYGDYNSSFVFENISSMNVWLNNEYPRLKEKYDDLSYSIRKLDNLHIGDKCYVAGEGDDEFIIIGLKKYSPNRYGFVLDSG